ncbi:EcoAI/FtnUII family type I restriction enzme subunit R [Prevotella sp.]|uniref:EcoAI/FtnUII family type I restriction enzme subunit R n=1 Tax=Prevotella sp. TaxID=59823 RepID=UPI0026490778|nr:DEAD/DEAH box helicase family protein [Prevotella sp.]MDN5554165.1 DEAD/DEAH box helicase family protein [Prevotella sp.]
MVNKKTLSEEDIKRQFITPAINKAGWEDDLFRMEYSFTDGRVIFDGYVHDRQARKRADYVLFDRNDYPLAIIEAKDNNKPIGGGMQQAIDYAEILDLKFAYSSNGDAFLEHDFLTGKEREIALDEFPAPNELRNRLNNVAKLTPTQQSIVNIPYYSDVYSHELRYYQRIAINRTIEAIAKGRQRILIVMATGTGKTYTAFQIIHRLHKSGKKKKILYLADRNILIDQTMNQDFKPFKKFMTKVQGGEIDSAFEVYMALYHQLVGKDGEPDPFLQVQPAFFDLIIVDECHRGSAKDDSAWRKVLEYFSSATQIGLTATPKTAEGANNLDYFNDNGDDKPIYTYSLLQGIKDGFLAPYRVTNCFINLDLQGFTPEEDELDLYKRPIEQRFYQQKDYGRNIAFLKRRLIVAHRITKMLYDIGRMTKTIVFCSDIEEAEAMRSLLVSMNADMCQEDSRYVMRITGDEIIGKKQLDNFIDVDQLYPTIVTTSELLATGVDCKTCGLIVLDKEIGSMTEFKQIIGRGTRLRTDKGKWHLEILDFRNATKKFKDPDFDGEPVPPKTKLKVYGPPPEPKDRVAEESPAKYIVDGQNVSIETEIVSVLGEDGKTMRTESVKSFTKKQICRRYKTLDEFIKDWSQAERKEAIVNELKELSVLINAVRIKNKALADADIFDIICHVAFDQPALTRRERAENVKKRNYFAKYEGKARQVLEALLEKYAENGIMEFEDVDVLDHSPFDTIGKPQKIVKLFGGVANFEKALRELESEIYKATA